MPLTPSQDNRCPGQEFNQTSPKYNSEALQHEPACLVFEFLKEF